jgi:hypothetical protein
MKKIIISFVVSFLLLSSLANAATNIVNAAKGEEDWKVKLTPYVWIASAQDEINIGGREFESKSSLTDYVNRVNFGLVGRCEVSKGRWSLIGNIIAISPDQEVESKNSEITGEAKLNSNLLFTELGGSFLLFPAECGVFPAITFAVSGGGRFVSLYNRVKLDSGQDYSDNINYGEPFIGGCLKFIATEELLFGLRGNAGGFSIGSELTWDILLEVVYEINDTISLNVGYSILDIYYTRGSGDDKLKLDMQLQGPGVGLTFIF